MDKEVHGLRNERFKVKLNRLYFTAAIAQANLCR